MLVRNIPAFVCFPHAECESVCNLAQFFSRLLIVCGEQDVTMDKRNSIALFHFGMMKFYLKVFSSFI